MTLDANPRLSIVLATPDGFETIARTVAALRAQTVGDAIELLLVTPSRRRLGLDEPAVASFAGCIVVETGVELPLGRANAAGARRASAPVVAFAEDHSFPEPRWAESLLAAHAGPWAVVGPAVTNANPATAVSWADLFIGYGPWLAPARAGEVDLLPGHNSAYKREILLAYDDELETLLETETLFHWRLREEGERLFLEPAARVAHANFSRWRSWLAVQYLQGRHFAGSRRAAMSMPARALYAAAAPAIPLVRLARVARGARAAGLGGRLLSHLPLVLLGLGVDAAGQMAGYAAGPGRATGALARYEARRDLHVTAADRREVFGA